ncbi:type II toxin-antitoxin system RelE/ParE family toxin [Desulfurivibrio sp. D14AmB]|uniref:type II toxin-antitoxin system RelE/ParE family toxin n=1 Tax=Desulfurivibrio sp. D14AmB TaxID=3374370 RepID=UPI00376F2720
MSRPWIIRLTRAAEDDFQQIIRWTAANFGRRQAGTYARTLATAIEALRGGPNIVGARPREEIGPGIHTLHVARRGRRGRHFVVFRASRTEQFIDVLRLLHDGMDLQQHLPPETPPEK